MREIKNIIIKIKIYTCTKFKKILFKTLYIYKEQNKNTISIPHEIFQNM